MTDHDPFPNVKDKLTAPTKKSAFEKSRLEAEAKRLREEAETAAVLKDFVASFDEPEPPLPFSSSSSSRGSFRGGGARGGGGGGGIGRRHFTAQPPPAALQRKRNLEAAFERDGDDAGGVFGGVVGGLGEREKRRLGERNVGLLAFENSVGGAKDDDDDDDSDSETSKPHPKPTLSLTSLPPSATKPILTALLASTALRIDSIRIIPAPPPPGPSQPSPSIRKAASALITLSPETPSSDIDAAVTSLNGRYLGTGFWLAISRHLPSTITTATPLSTPTTAPFNATAPTPSTSTHRHRHRPPPPAHRGGFAPPANYRAPPSSATTATAAPASLQVHVTPPNDIRQLRLIHKTLEALITHGPAFEALLMASDDVRADPRFAWLWDARSPAGVYYRWKLWSLVTGQHRPPPAIEVFEPTPALAALWIPPRRALRYEFAGAMRDVREDSDFSSEELLDEEEDEGGAGGAAEGVEKRGYLGVLGRAKLVHLVARVPTQTMKVRRGDVGRVMAFAMEHAEGGMGEEVVDVLVGNVLRPLAFTRAAKSEDDDDDNDDDDNDEKDKEEGSGEKGAEETHAAKIVALWIISDVLSNSSLGIRNAWRYRQLFDVALRERGVFAHLGEVYRTPGWGRMKAEKFRRGVVEGVLEWWEKWCIFPQTTQDAFLTSFLTPPTPPTTGPTSTSTTSTTTKPPTSTTSSPAPTAAPKSKWKTVETTPSSFNPLTADLPAASPTSDVDGEPMADDDDDDDVDGEPMLEDDDDGDNDGEPMQEDNEQEDNGEEEEEEEEDGDRDVKEMFDDGAAVKPSFTVGAGVGGGLGGGVRKRMRAEDMFADEE